MVCTDHSAFYAVDYYFCRLHEIIEIDIFKDIFVYDKQYGSALVCKLISNLSPEPFESCWFTLSEQ